MQDAEHKATGRLPSNDPNLQNIPLRTTEGRLVREAFSSELRGSTPTITHVAIRYKGVVHSLPAPNRHHDVIRSIGGINGPDTQGFLDSNGRFLNRAEAMVLAINNGQLNRRVDGYQGPELYSEDLWG